MSMRAKFASLLLVTFTVAIALSFFPPRTEVAAQAGGGHIRGYVYGFDMYNQLIPIVWADIVATNDIYTFTAYSGEGGYYELLLPTGSFTLTVSEPGYKDYSMDISISNGSSTPINFYLEPSQTPIPEFSTYVAAITMIAAFASVLVLTRRVRKTKH